jgi:hypothetical protein
MTILIHGTPQIVLLAIDSEEELVQIPSITEASLFLPKRSVHIPKAQTEAMINPYGVADDFRREPVSVATG